MLEALEETARHYSVRQFLVVLEEKMACGAGTCLGCATRIKDLTDDAREAAFHYERVCTEGPVFDGYRVIYRM